MKPFNVYKHPTLGFEAVKIGFSWPAFFFGLFWVLYKRLWKIAGLWVLAALVFMLIAEGTPDLAPGQPPSMQHYLLLAVNIAFWLVPAVYGNRWLEIDLGQRGYELVTTTQALTPQAAIAQVAGQDRSSPRDAS